MSTELGTSASGPHRLDRMSRPPLWPKRSGAGSLVGSLLSFRVHDHLLRPALFLVIVAPGLKYADVGTDVVGVPMAIDRVDGSSTWPNKGAPTAGRQGERNGLSDVGSDHPIGSERRV